MTAKYIMYASLLGLCIAGCSKDTNTRTGRPSTPVYNVNSTLDVQYGQNTNYLGENQKMLLDIYSPKNASASRTYPLVVMAHGGSFLEGDKSGLADICSAIAEKGYIAVSIEYRLGWDYGNAPSPAACEGDTVSLQKAVYRSLQDYNAALRFLVHNADKYFIDTSWIFAGGSSAGAVTAVNTIYVTPEFANDYYKGIVTDLGELKTADNALKDTYTVKGNINMWGAIVETSLITPNNAVPMVAFHGSQDSTVPFTVNHFAYCPNYPVLSGSQTLYNLLTSYGVPAVLHIAEGEGHGPDEYQDPEFFAPNVDCFLRSVMSKSAKTGTYQNLASNCQ